MTRSRNLLPFGGFVVCLAALFSYPLFFAQFPATRDVPWVNWMLFALGLVLAGIGLLRPLRRPDRYRGRIIGPIFVISSLAVLGFFVVMTEIWSRQLPASADAPRVGEKAPDFTLPDANGRSVRLSDVGPWKLLIFYRGYW